MCGRLPGGLDASLGELGARLSGGERQRIATARAIVRGAPILLLDKPARRVDAVTLQAVWNSLAEFGERRTVLLAPHRLEGLWAMDEILVLEQGRIVARGRHAELLRLGGTYSRMWEA